MSNNCSKHGNREARSGCPECMPWLAFDVEMTPTALGPWRVGEFISSARRPAHVLMLAVGEAQIASYGAHPDFVRWVSQ